MISITDGLRCYYNSNMKEKTPLELERENRILQSNWNSLRELIEKEIINTKKCMEYNIKNNLDYSEYKRDIVRFEFILDKMNELEGKVEK